MPNQAWKSVRFQVKINKTLAVWIKMQYVWITEIKRNTKKQNRAVVYNKDTEQNKM